MEDKVFAQVVRITISDGRVVEATVPAFLSDDDEDVLSIDRIEVSPPFALPDGVRFDHRDLAREFIGDDDE